MLLAFLHMTYFLTFALAFHDKTAEHGALRASAVEDPDTAAKLPADLTPHESTCKNPDATKVWELFFVDKNFDLNLTNQARKLVKAQHKEDDLCRQGQGGRIALLKKLGMTSATEEEMRVAAWNVREVIELTNLLALAHQNTPHRDHIIEMRSHASDTPLRQDTGTFSSQVDVSLVRAYNAQELFDVISREVAGSEEPQPLLFRPPISVGNISNNFWGSEFDAADASSVGLDRKLSVEFKITPHVSANEIIMKAHDKPPLSLLDYVYFMIYTVTTTGYGDIAPSSNGAKFIVSIANLFELFFLVLVFNSLAGFAYSPTERARDRLRFVTRRERFRQAAPATASSEAAAEGIAATPEGSTSEPPPVKT
jgi:hypothetical protein